MKQVLCLEYYRVIELILVTSNSKSRNVYVCVCVCASQFIYIYKLGGTFEAYFCCLALAVKGTDKVHTLLVSVVYR